MKIIKDLEFLQVIKDKHLLLDTNFFFDATSNPTEFHDFIEEIKKGGTIIVALNATIIEFLKGAINVKIFEEKKEFLFKIIDTILPIEKDIMDEMYELVKEYKEYGKALSTMDFLLGATLMKYSERIFLLTKDTTDFPTTIFTLESHICLVKDKALQVYGLYSY